MRRRTLLTSGSAAVVATPAIAQNTRVLRFVPRTGLVDLDPVYSVSQVTRILALAVYESLFSVDENLAPRPQMAAGHTVDRDGKLWTIKLREGLHFHDGEPVLARDCVASIIRWMKRDLVGRGMAPRVDAVEAPDDRTVVFRLNKPFPPLAFALGKPLPNHLPIMPARLAATDATKPLTEIIGSGPFRFLPNEFSIGASATIAKFEQYAPRDEPPNGTSGGRRVFLDRVEWVALPDPATAANALMTGEVDWVDTPHADLVSSLKKRRDVTAGQLDPYGNVGFLRLNHLQGPTANRAIRQAMLAAIDQVEVMQAVAGDDPALYNAPVGFFVPESPSATRSGMERVGGHRTEGEVRAMLQAAGYRGERLVSLHATDDPARHVSTEIVVARLRAVGMNIDDIVTDIPTIGQRIVSKEPIERGGWSMFTLFPSGSDHFDPLVALGLRTSAAAWFGWPRNQRMEDLRTAWIDSEDVRERQGLAAAIQEEGLTEVVMIPLGRVFRPSAWRSNVSGIVKTVLPVFWNVRKT